MHYRILFVLLMHLVITSVHSQNKPLKVGVIGLTHTHVHWVFGSEPRGDIEIVGIVEPNTELAQRYADQYQFSMTLVYPSIEAMLEKTQPEAVTAFGTIFEHLEVVQAAAPRGIHVMVEKPLAVNMDHAVQMKELANKHRIHLLTNYETTWYPTTHKAYQLAKQQHAIGDIRKIMVQDGHKGPKKIGINKEFLDWLTSHSKRWRGCRRFWMLWGKSIDMVYGRETAS